MAGSFGLTGVGALLTGGDIAASTAGTYGGLGEVFGRRPEVADYTPVDLSEEQIRALTGNLANADSIEALLNRMVPGWSEMLRTGTSNATSLLHGEIPQDVQEQIQRSTAYQALQGGFGASSGMGRSLTSRDLGRTSLDLMSQGNNAAQTWAKLAETSYSPFITDTAMHAGVTAANNAGEQATEQARFNVEAAPDPGAAGAFALNSAIGMQLLSFGMGAAGGAMGGAGGGRTAAPATGGTFNYAGQGYGGQGWQYNPTTGSYQPILRATWGGG